VISTERTVATNLPNVQPERRHREVQIDNDATALTGVPIL
jgi:hypothetical protein